MNLKVGDKVRFNPHNDLESIEADIELFDYEIMMYRIDNDIESKVTMVQNSDVYLEGMECAFSEDELIVVTSRKLNKWKGKPR